MPPDEPIRIRVAETPHRTAAKRRANRTWLWIGSAAVSTLIAVAAIAVMFNFNSGNRPPAQPTAPSATPSSEPGRPAPGAPQASSLPAPSAGAQVELVDDPAGQFLWAAPTTGPPISLAYVPAGAQCLIHLRPAALFNHSEGQRVLSALGPWGRDQLEELQAILGSDLASVASLLVTITVDNANELQDSFRVAFHEPLDDAKLAQRLAGATRSQLSEGAVYTRDGRAYFLVNQPTPALIVVPQSLAAELIDSRGEEPPLVRDVEALVEQSDADRDATVILAPKFLQTSGNELLPGDAATLREALRWLLDDEATAVAFSLDWGDDFFAELQATPALNVPPRRLATKLRERIAAAPAAIEEMVLAEPWHPYGRKVIARLPGMLRTLARYARSGEEDRTAIVRIYLPAGAGHNLLMAGELLLTQPRGAADPATTAASASPPSVAEKLARTASLSFTKETLEQAVALLADDMGVEIVIAGGDLQLDGITKNQSLELDLRNRPASEILLEILLRANPHRQATRPADVRQKLVYVVEPTTTGAAERIIVTTRTAAEKRGDKLPEPFRSPSR